MKAIIFSDISINNKDDLYAAKRTISTSFAPFTKTCGRTW